MSPAFTAVDELAVNTIRTLSIDAIERANSGHPGLPMGAAPMAYVLWQRHLKHNPAHPEWPDRDRFILSAGHGSMLLYSLLHLTGYDLALDDIKNFRQLDSRTPGHPEFGLTPGVEATTGPLGQGTANAVGMAMAEKWMAARYNRPGHTVVDHFTYALVSDGDLMEGISAEAASIAAHMKLGKLVYLYDANEVCLDGPLDMCFTEDVGKRYEAHGWHVQHVANGDTDLGAIDTAIEQAKEDERPSLIIVRTTIGYGSPNKGGLAASHGAPLGEEEARLAKQQLGWTETEPFSVPADAAAHLRSSLERGAEAHTAWLESFAAWEQAETELAAEWKTAQSQGLPEGFDSDLPAFTPGEKIATRAAGGKALNALANRIPFLVGGDADLSCSTKTGLSGEGAFHEGKGRNIHFGVREHAMGAIANGMAYHGGIRPFTGTFFVFSDYMRPSIRLAAMNHLPVTFVFTHDSLGVGEDGPTHQPIEQLMSLRAIPNLRVIRPGDAKETAEAWRMAATHTDGPTLLVLSRQGLPVLEQDTSDTARGGYVLVDAPSGTPEVILIATGSEVALAMEAREKLAAEGIAARVVSMPCWEVFSEQDAGWREAVLPSNVTARVSIEAGVTLGWERWIGMNGRAIGVDRFGSSAPGNQVFEAYGFTVERVVEAARVQLGKPVGSTR